MKIRCGNLRVQLKKKLDDIWMFCSFLNVIFIFVSDFFTKRSYARIKKYTCYIY